ncbi:MAG: hypothetical protein QOJ79_2241 [Actinomycetota bacterium]|jgi:signal transduction histidine kinase|nr:hypothetical protein [Actinomycetota bacterium]
MMEATTPRRSPKTWWLIGLLAFIVGWHMALVQAGHLTYLGRVNWLEAVGPAYVFVVAGFLVWRQRQDNRTGRLMVAFGLLWLIPTLEMGSRVPLLWTIGATLGWPAYTVLVYLVLAFPRGRLLTRPARLTMAVVITALFLTSGPAFIYFYDPAVAGCVDCQPHLNLLLVHARQHFIEVSNLQVGSALTVAAAFLFIGILGSRLVRASWPQRRVAGPLFMPAIAWALVVTYFNAAQVSFWTFHRPIWLSGNGTFIQIVQHLLAEAILVMPLGVLFGLWQAGLRRAKVSGMVVELGDLPEDSRLDDVVARNLGDPTARIGYPVTDGGFVTRDGAPLHLPSDESGRAVTVLESAGSTRAVIVHDAALLAEPELLASVGAAVRLFVENERLQAEVRAKLEDVRASRARLVQAADGERRRVERDLHDGAQQRLLALGLALGRAERRIETDTAAARAIMVEAAAELDGALDEIRELARGIHPAILQEQGLEAALQMLAQRCSVPVALDTVPGQRLSALVETTAYFVVSEALTNVAKYARASGVRVRVEQRAGRLVVEVTDDGVGGADASNGSGLRGLEDRVAAVGGVMSVDSPDGAGTRLFAELPCG